MGLMAEKGSCRYLYNKTQLLPENMCLTCIEHSRWSTAKLAQNKDSIKGTCRKLYYENGARIAVRPTTQTTTPRQPAKRSRRPPTLIEVTPTAKMFGNRYSCKASSVIMEPTRTIESQASNRIAPNPLPVVSPTGNPNQPESPPTGTSSLSTSTITADGTIINKTPNKNTTSTHQTNKSTATACQCSVKSVLKRCSELGGGKVNTSRGGKSKSAVNKQKAYERGVLEGVQKMGLFTHCQIIVGKSNDVCLPTSPPICPPVNSPALITNIAVERLGRTTLNHVKSLSKPPEKRPYLAAIADLNQSVIEEALGSRISNEEMKKIRLHAIHPGPFVPVEKEKMARSKVPIETLSKMLRFLDLDGILQRYAYGSHLRTICGGDELAEIDNVARLKSLNKVTNDFLESLNFEISNIDTLPSSESRCQTMEKDTMRRCCREKCHDGRCSFTGDGSMSKSTIKQLVSALAPNDIKSLSGLDDTKVMKGALNFSNMRKLMEEVAPAESKAELVKKITETELYYKTSYSNHLQRKGNLQCNCLTCGFSGKDGTECPDRAEHLNSCAECSLGFDILSQLKQYNKNKGPMSDSNIDVDQYQERHRRLEECHENLVEYRSHLARHVSESEYEAKLLTELDNDTALVKCDWKMKILSCYFRENQQKFFGKSGTSCLGFMIVTNNTSNSDSASKHVSFLMAFTDDKCQDEWAVASAKKMIYESHLPPEITKCIFVSDGASCFRNKLLHALQPCWKSICGIDEVELLINPAGGGKSELDGMFGRLSRIMKSSVDEGNSHDDAASALANVSRSNGLAATTFLIFRPSRDTRLYAKFLNGLSIEGVLNARLQDDGSLVVRRHSGYGTGTTIAKASVIFATDKDMKCLVAFDKVPEYVAGCVEIRVGTNRKEALPSVKVEAGQGANDKNQRRQQRQSRVVVSHKRHLSRIENERERKRSKRYYMCKEKDKHGRYCKREFRTLEGLQGHQEGFSKHTFLKNRNVKDFVIHIASQPGGLMATGSRPNRVSINGVPKTSTPSPVGTAGSEEAICYGKLHRREQAKSYHKPERLLKELKRLFDIKPALSPEKAFEELSAMRDDNGGMLFCWKRRGEVKIYAKTSTEYKAWAGCSMCGMKPCSGCNGKCPTISEIKAYFSSLAQKRKSENPAST